MSRFDLLRRKMVEQQLSDIVDPRVREAMESIPRHLFLEQILQDRSYEDGPLPIGLGQTISQPWIVARVTELLELKGSESVLEVGCGSGYQAAILSRLASRVVTIERHSALAERARKVISDLGLRNVSVLAADGTYGRSDLGPWDAILVSAGAPEPPAPLLAQLAAGGRLVLPMGDMDSQILTRVRRSDDGERFLAEERFEPCRFVPLLGRFGWKESA